MSSMDGIATARLIRDREGSRNTPILEEERARLAREVHDEHGQTLTGLKMDLAWLEKRLPK